MKIGIFCPTFNVYGGGEFVAATIANTLAKNNYDVILFTNNEINQREIEKFFGKPLHQSIKVMVKPSISQPRGLLDFYQTVFRSYLFKTKCDIWIDVYSNCVFPWTNISYIHFPIPNHRIYNIKFPYIKKKHIREVGLLPYVILEKNFVKDEGKLLIANSQYTAEEIRKFLNAKAWVIYPPIPSIFFDRKLEANINDRNQRQNLVITISRFAPEKELEKIPYIASLTDKSIKFAVIGRVHYKKTLYTLQKLIKKFKLTDRIKFFPDIALAEMKEILKKAKIYLHVTTGEHFGISIVQAMSMGCIPIVHNSGGPKEFIPQELRYKNIEEAAMKIAEQTLEWTPQKAMKIMEVAEKFKEENFAKEFIKLFENYVKVPREIKI